MSGKALPTHLLNGSLCSARNRPNETKLPQESEAVVFNRLAKAECRKSPETIEAVSGEYERKDFDEIDPETTFEAMSVCLASSLRPVIFAIEERALKPETQPGEGKRAAMIAPSSTKDSSYLLDGKSIRLTRGYEAPPERKSKLFENSSFETKPVGHLPLNAKMPEGTVERSAVKATEFFPFSLFAIQSPIPTVPIQNVPVAVANVWPASNIKVEKVVRDIGGSVSAIELSLHPNELGRITVRFHYQEGQVLLKVTAEKTEVANNLAQDCTSLMRVLADHIPGLERAVVQVDQQTFQPASNAGQTGLAFGTFSENNKRPNRLAEPPKCNSFETVTEQRPNRSNATKTGILI